ncbi:MAG: HD domain-containing protein, partial [Oscillospiraceae bacterium]|nr:HD domain-containing protein [Oscillospiraceae bacterium]
MDISLPTEVRHIIDTLKSRGFAAYAVGGCVRDSLRGVAPKDWDICTSALPEQTAQCFSGYHIIETGLQHGTITVRVERRSFEVTTFRVDGEYSDSRRPDDVRFVTDVTVDLARRDFTMNAMAFDTELIDPFGGRRDLEARVIRCVGDANARFREDALRIMRALRFASALGFRIEDETLDAIFANSPRLKYIAAERIAVELNGLLLGGGVLGALTAYRDVLGDIIPELRPAFDFEQHNKHHIYDVWTHTAHAVAAAPPELTVRLALLLHDLGKPSCYTKTDGVGHFYGHPNVSAELAHKILRRLKYPRETARDVEALVLWHDAEVLPTARSVKRWLNRMTTEQFRRLLSVKRGDVSAQAEPYRTARLASLSEVERVLDTVIDERQCFSLHDLAVKGGDIAELGASGAVIGAVLSELLALVTDDELPNERAVLLAAARKILSR